MRDFNQRPEAGEELRMARKDSLGSKFEMQISETLCVIEAKDRVIKFRVRTYLISRLSITGKRPAVFNVLRQSLLLASS